MPVQIIGGPGGNVAVVNPDGSLSSSATLATALSAEYDSLDVSKMSKGAVTTVFSGITADATSTEIKCNGFNALLLHVVITGTWDISVQNSLVSGGTFVAAYDGANQLKTGALTTSRSVLLRGVADWVQLFADNSVAGTCTLMVQPVNV